MGKKPEAKPGGKHRKSCAETRGRLLARRQRGVRVCAKGGEALSHRIENKVGEGDFLSRVMETLRGGGGGGVGRKKEQSKRKGKRGSLGQRTD